MLRLVLLSVTLIFNSLILNCQDLGTKYSKGNNVFKAGISSSYPVATGNGINYEDRLKILNILNLEKLKLIEEEILVTDPNKGIIFDLPIKQKEGLGNPGFYSISAYVDHNLNFPNQLQDYSCGEITYDVDNGYNHEGTDYYLWPFPWFKMENNEVEAIAAAPGIIIYKIDGNFDQNCDGEDLPWNAIFVQHENGYTSWYGHLKEGSLTDKFVGEEVETGEYLGIVGSSGISIIPHLHFEVHDETGAIVDPFFGECNPDLEESLWSEQTPYLESGINYIATNQTIPTFPDCPFTEQRNESNTFSGNDTIFLTAFFRNFTKNEDLSISIIRPDGTIWEEWLWTNPLDFYTASWNYWFIILKGEMDGNWKYKLQHENNIYEHSFYYSNEASIFENRIQRLSITPNPVTSVTRVNTRKALTDNLKIAVTNAMGNKIQIPYSLEPISGSVLLDCQKLPAGVYFIQIENNKTIASGKLIKR
jgi:hypothetical protein